MLNMADYIVDQDIANYINVLNDSNDNKDNQIVFENIITSDDFIDERDEIEWIDIFDISNLASDGRLYSAENHRWLGADWTLLVMRHDNEMCSLYVGYNESKHFPDNWCANIMYEFTLIEEDDKEINLTCDSFMFIPNELGREDRGKGGCFKYEPKELKIRVNLREMSKKTNLSLTQKQQYNSKISTGMVGLINNGATCYLNSLLQMLFNINKFRYAVYQLPHESEIFSESTTLALQSVFKNLQYSMHEVSTQELTTAFGWSNQDADIQQDVQEMMRVLLDKLEEKMKGTSVDGIIRSLFGGKFCSYIKCVNVEYESKREEDFYDIQLEVKNCKNLYDSFKKYTEVEMLDGENQYDAGEYGKQNARKGVVFTSFPPVLTIHLKRFDFDFNYMSFIKINDNYEFPAYLELDQFLAEDAKEEDKNNRYLLHSVLVHSGDVGGGHYYAYIRPSCGFNYSNTESEMKQASEDLSKSNNELEPSKMTKEEAKIKIISEGAGGKWFKFNDEIVTSAQSKEAIKFCFGSKLIHDKKFGGSAGSAYMLVYIKESMASAIMNENQCEIPPHLLERLESERIRREIERKKEKRSRQFSWFRYATESSISEVRACDFSEYKFLSSMMKGSYHLFALCRIAKDLKVSPTMIRLWINDDRTFIQIKDYKEMARLGQYYYVEIIGKNDDENIDEIDNIMLEEAKLMELFSNELNSLGFNEFEIKECTDGFGIGGPSALFDLVLNDDDLIASLNKGMDTLTERMLQLVNSQIEKTDESIYFLRIFDYQDFLPKDIWQIGSSKRKLEAIDNSDISFLETMKYLGSDKLNYNMSNRSTHQVISDILVCYRSIADRIARHLALQNGVSSDTIFNTLYDSFDIYHSNGMGKIPNSIYTKDGDDLETIGKFDAKGFPAGSEFIISMSRSSTRRVNKYVEKYYFEGEETINVRGYIYYVFYKRDILFFAHSQREKDIVLRTMGVKDNYHPLKKIKYSNEVEDDHNNEQDFSEITLDIPSYLPVYKVLHILSEQLKVSPQRLIIFLTNENLAGTKYFYRPLTYSSDLTSIKTIAHDQRIAKSFDRIMYVIAPYDTVYPSLDNSIRLCISLVDASSRQIHQQLVNSIMSTSSLSNGKDPEFYEERAIYLELPGYDINLIGHCVNTIKNEIGLPADLDSDIVEFPTLQDYLKVQKIIIDIIAQVSDTSYKITKYPLIFFMVDNNDQSLLKLINVNTRLSDSCFNDICLGGINMKKRKLCIQHVPLVDLSFIAAINPVPSRVLYVINFTLTGKAVNPCDVFGEPFFSYVKEDDDYDSLVARFIQITGDTEISKLRLAVVDDKVPNFIIRPSSSSSSSSLSTESESQNNSIYNFINGFATRGPIYIGVQRLSSSIANSRKSIGSITIK